MSEYSCISLDALSTQVNTLPNEVNQWRFLAISPEGVTYLVNAASMVPVNSICTNHIVNNAITCDKISAKEIHTKHVSNIDHTCIGGLGSAAVCDATAFATSGHNHNGTYLGINACAADSAKLGGKAASSYCTSSYPTLSSLGALSTTGDAASAKKISCSYICFGSNCIWIG